MKVNTIGLVWHVKHVMIHSLLPCQTFLVNFVNKMSQNQNELDFKLVQLVLINLIFIQVYFTNNYFDRHFGHPLRIKHIE